ncbi:MAG: crotonase/enoyl-CoA hydratase family protein [Myxococcota bacterium]
MSETVTLETSGDVAVLRLDDGKANALGPPVLDAINVALDQVEESGQALLLTGRPNRFSAGFDLGVMREGGPEAGRAMVTAGGRLAIRLGRLSVPVVIACNGHALAMGAVLLMAADHRVGSAGDFKVGFNEVAIGMTTPLFLLELARERMSKRHFLRGTVEAEVYGPDEAIDAGFFDEVVAAEANFETALAAAERLGKLPRKPFLNTRARARGGLLDEIERGLEADVAKAFPA